MAQNAAIWWIRRDLRLQDNPALVSALTSSEHVVPLFILDDSLLKSRYASDKRTAFLFEGLRQLDQQIQQRGGNLIVRRGQPEQVLEEVRQEKSARAIFAEADFSPYARTRDSRIVGTLPLTFVSHPTVTNPDDVLKRDGTPYTVFTPYSREWKRVVSEIPDIIDAPECISTPEINSEPIPDTPQLPDSVPFSAGTDAAGSRLREFCEGQDAAIYRYADERDRLDLDGTSRLSPYLRFGMLSAREAVVAAMKAIERTSNQRKRSSAEAWLNELIWREFYAAVLHHFPHVRTREFHEQHPNLKWINDPEDFASWKEAQTGYPIVDACIRQLHSEGWMHNRGRMITASFLVKHLLVDWRWGEQHFMAHRLDGDPASNNGGWQWSAGTGTDAASYFRVFNPTLQAGRHDPRGDFIRRWIPELQSVPDSFIHEPRKMSGPDQERAGIRIDRDYPRPVIDHKFARQRALDTYGQS